MRTFARWLLGAFLAFAGTAHLTFARQEFRAQVPSWVPVGADAVVVASGVVEVVLGLALIALPSRHSRRLTATRPTVWIFGRSTIRGAHR